MGIELQHKYSVSGSVTKLRLNCKQSDIEK